MPNNENAARPAVGAQQIAVLIRGLRAQEAGLPDAMREPVMDIVTGIEKEVLKPHPDKAAIDTLFHSLPALAKSPPALIELYRVIFNELPPGWGEAN